MRGHLVVADLYGARRIEHAHTRRVQPAQDILVLVEEDDKIKPGEPAAESLRPARRNGEKVGAANLDLGAERREFLGEPPRLIHHLLRLVEGIDEDEPAFLFHLPPPFTG